MIKRNCPICDVPLETGTYEGFRVLRCPQCHGHLLELTRYETIRRIPEATLHQLENEARSDFRGDTAARLRCPRCHRAMEKRPLSVPGFDLHLDVCRPCALVWLDGGELAMAQLKHQSTPGFRDTQAMKRRARAVAADPDRKAELDDAIERLPRSGNPVTAGFRDALIDAIHHIVARSALRWPLR